MTLRSLYAAATGMNAQQTTINSIANNLANLNTTGYKMDRAAFEDLMYDQIKTPGASNASSTQAPIGIQLGHGSKLTGVYKEFTQGELVQTNRELDIAIQGRGFLKVTLEDGTSAYTRDGSLRVDSEGNMVDSRGNALDPSFAIPADATSVTIGDDGTVTVSTSGESAPTELGQIQLSMFTNEAGLKAIGRNLYQETEASGTPSEGVPGLEGAGLLSQGFLENSNVNVAEQLISMIIAQRSYEANSKVLQTSSEMMRNSSNIS